MDKTQQIQNEREKLFIEINNDLYEIVEGIEYEMPLEQAKDMGFDEDLGDDDANK